MAKYRIIRKSTETGVVIGSYVFDNKKQAQDFLINKKRQAKAEGLYAYYARYAMLPVLRKLFVVRPEDVSEAWQLTAISEPEEHDDI